MSDFPTHMNYDGEVVAIVKFHVSTKGKINLVEAEKVLEEKARKALTTILSGTGIRATDWKITSIHGRPDKYPAYQEVTWQKKK